MKQNFSHFFILILMLAAGLVLFWYVRPNTSLQLLVGVATSIAYIIWGIMHHAIRKDLHQKVVVEYVLIGAIAIVLLITMLGY